MQVLIKAAALTKHFGQATAVDGIDFGIETGEVFGFLGPNGAGKTTTMRMIACVSEPSGGDLSVLGMDPLTQGAEIRGRMGVVPQQDTLDTDLTVRDNLLVYGRYFGLPRQVIRERVVKLLEFARLTDRSDGRVESLSGGMRRRLVIARALINEPDIVLLDEPTSGLDPQARHLLWERLYQLKRDGITQVLTTHYMDEAEQLCDRLVIMDQGRIVAKGSPRALIDEHVTREVVEFRYDSPDLHPAAVAELRDRLDGTIARIEPLGDRVLAYTDRGDEVAALDHQTPPYSVLVRRSTLEDVFLRLTGRALDDV